MTNDFDFSSIGKREPYRVPEGFFPALEAGIMSAAAAESRRRRLRRILAWSGSIAAAVAVALVGVLPLSPAGGMDAFAEGDVQQSFACLSDADQDLVLSVYQEDIFINL